MLKNYKMLTNFIKHNCKDNLNFKLQNAQQDNIDCFICFMPYEQHNQIKMLSKFSHIIQNCKCNVNIHLLCLNNWIKKTQSCPICRTKCINIQDIGLQEINLQRYYILLFINICVFIISIVNFYIFIHLDVQYIYRFPLCTR